MSEDEHTLAGSKGGQGRSLTDGKRGQEDLFYPAGDEVTGDLLYRCARDGYH